MTHAGSRRRWLAGVAVLAALTLHAQDDFGTVTVTLDDGTPVAHRVENATLYKDVDLSYDTTLFVRSDSVGDFYYYPQFNQGRRYVLHLILASGESGAGEPESSFDVYFDLGDTLRQPLTLTGVDSAAYAFQGGLFSKSRQYSTGQEGTFDLAYDEAIGTVEGRFDTRFDFATDPGLAERHRVAMAGDLRIPESKVLVGKEGSLAPQEVRKDDFQRNIVIALITVAFVVAFALR